MTLHFNVGEAKAKLSQLIAAVRRGEDVVIDHDGKPQVRLVMVEQAAIEERKRRIEKRAAAFGMWREEFEGWDTSLEALKQGREYSEKRRKLHDDDLR